MSQRTDGLPSSRTAQLRMTKTGKASPPGERPGDFPQKPAETALAATRPPPAAAHCRTALMRDLKRRISSVRPCKELPWG
jgi:hypothetical protein